MILILFFSIFLLTISCTAFNSTGQTLVASNRLISLPGNQRTRTKHEARRRGTSLRILNGTSFSQCHPPPFLPMSSHSFSGDREIYNSLRSFKRIIHPSRDRRDQPGSDWLWSSRDNETFIESSSSSFNPRRRSTAASLIPALIPGVSPLLQAFLASSLLLCSFPARMLRKQWPNIIRSLLDNIWCCVSMDSPSW